MVANPGGKKVSSVPFPAIVGQAECKRVLLAVAANDALSGALLVGEKGTAKSTAVRALVDLLPEQRAIADCPYSCPPDEPAAQCSDCREREDPPVETRPTPLVTLPLGATRDRVVGTLSVADALAGEADFDPGLLARANRGILYVDEVNLLADHLVDVLLDAAASGTNTVERDGVSRSHPAEFTLIGTMNPEEGDLRPQLRDRFDLQATVTGASDLEDRVEIIDRALERPAGDGRGPDGGYEDDLASLETRLERARTAIDDDAVDLLREHKTDIAALCLEAGVDGHRGDIATARTAITVAALDGRTRVLEGDVREAASYTLPHRLQSTPFEESANLEDVLEEHFDGGDRESTDDVEWEGNQGDETSKEGQDEGSRERGDEGSKKGGDDGDDRSANEPAKERSESSTATDSRDDTGADETERPPRSEHAARGQSTGDPGPAPAAGDDAVPEPEQGDGAATGAANSDGDGVRERADADRSDDAEPATPVIPGQRRPEIGEATAPSVDADGATNPNGDGDGTEGGSQTRASGVESEIGQGRGARIRTEPAIEGDTIDAAASIRTAATRGHRRVEPDDLRRSVRERATAATVVFAVDASASMRSAMGTAKGVVLEYLRESYENRDEVAVVAFAGEDSEVLLPPTTSVSLAARHLKELPTGDRTPLPEGLETAERVLERAESDLEVVVLVTDGRANVAQCEDGDGTESPTAATRRAARSLAKRDAHVVIVDAGDDSRAGVTELIAAETDADVVGLSALSLETVASAVDEADDGSSGN
ncbi:VWA domain-containing protein [Halobacteria archaeon AArc-m2/3/4]|uniref:VWA domain-containing protein n=1 Tax=Natronoglomus mannanivorans TaxID=2979990 RepID=A0ABT2QEM8_9EURY|nr:VWA domain-containing protein [Halobacteria archaeon AArc-m2/3/4]